ncbi:MAG: type I methionyl aminopeptidase [Nitrospira sp.]|nr:type I methionyl aminopeptidase [Nitrospira sp.]MDD9860706.1 type I methionyl aminopeptidase [Nitrospira sp.]
MIILKTGEEIALMAQAAKMVAEAHQVLQQEVKPGVTTLQLDKIAETFIRDHGGIPAFKGYRNFPSTLCASVNQEVVHGIPSNRALREGDIVGLDLGAIVHGFYGDGAVTVPVGPVAMQVHTLLTVTEEALYQGIDQARVGNRLSDIGHAIQRHVESHGFSVVRDFVGHGIGRQLHEDPQIPNYGRPGQGARLQCGMVLAIEPMVNVGGPQVQVLDDHWTAVTTDGSLSAHFEHTVAIQPVGPPEILTTVRERASVN